MGTFGKNVQSNHPSRKEDKGSNSWEFCSAEAAVAWPWSVRRGSAGGKWREDWRFQQQREITLLSPWFNKMRTQRRKSQTGEANSYCPVPVFLDTGRQKESWGVWGIQPPRWANGPLPPENQSCQSDQQNTTEFWSLTFPLGLLTLGETRCCIKQLYGDAHVVKNEDLSKPTEPQLWLNPAAPAESSGGWSPRQQLDYDLVRDPEPELPN